MLSFQKVDPYMPPWIHRMNLYFCSDSTYNSTFTIHTFPFILFSWEFHVKVRTISSCTGYNLWKKAVLLRTYFRIFWKASGSTSGMVTSLSSPDNPPRNIAQNTELPATNIHLCAAIRRWVDPEPTRKCTSARSALSNIAALRSHTLFFVDCQSGSGWLNTLTAVWDPGVVCKVNCVIVLMLVTGNQLCSISEMNSVGGSLPGDWKGRSWTEDCFTLLLAPTRTTSCRCLRRTVHALWNLYGNPYKNRAEKEEEMVTWWGNPTTDLISNPIRNVEQTTTITIAWMSHLLENASRTYFQ